VGGVGIGTRIGASMKPVHGWEAALEGSAAECEAGYVYPHFWGQPADQQQDMTATARQQPGAATFGVYATKAPSAGTWLFPPNPWQ